MADPLTHQIYGLIEHAELYQQAAADGQKALDAGARSLERATAGLDERIKQAVSDAVKEKLANTPSELGKAVVDALKTPIETLATASEDVSKVTGGLGWRAASVVAVIAFAAMLAPVGVWLLLVPSTSELQQLRADRDELQSETGLLRAAKAVQRCGSKGIYCARVDPNESWRTSDGATYYTLKP
jgi:hypothetical protein